MSDENMIERVAKAIAEAAGYVGNVRPRHEKFARAAIEAMREPTPEMIDVGQKRMGIDPNLHPAFWLSFRDVWESAIGEAMK